METVDLDFSSKKLGWRTKWETGTMEAASESEEILFVMGTTWDAGMEGEEKEPVEQWELHEDIYPSRQAR